MADRKAYMRQYMAERRAAAKARKTDVRTSPHEAVDTATPQPQAQPEIAVEPIIRGLDEAIEAQKAHLERAGFRRDWPPAPEIHPRHVVKPGFLAAPDDDCGACGHDRQAFHTGTPYCLAPVSYGRGGVCRCPAFVDSASPF